MKQSIQRFFHGSSARKYLLPCFAVILIVGTMFGIRMLSHKTVHVSGVLEYKSMDDLFSQSSLVAVGQLTGTPKAIRVQHVSEDSAANFTDYTFTISSILRGKADGDTVTVRVFGGTANNVKEIYDESPSFAEKEPYLLFLYQPGMGGGYNTTGDYYYICGTNQGVLSMDANGCYVSVHGEKLSDAQLNDINSSVPVDENYSRAQFLENQKLNLANGFISQEEYDTLISSMDTYAAIISK